jgi:hypothetical protein
MEFKFRVWLRLTEATTFTMFTLICLGMLLSSNLFRLSFAPL